MNDSDSGGVALTTAVKRIYEGMFLLDSGFASSNWDEAVGAINTVMERADAEVINLRKWDDRRLCYEIGPHKRGTYVLSYFRALPSAITGMERDVTLSETIIRVLVLRADHLDSDEQKAREQMEEATPIMVAEKAEAEAAEAAATRRDEADARKAEADARKAEMAKASGDGEESAADAAEAAGAEDDSNASSVAEPSESNEPSEVDGSDDAEKAE